jgi:hypothetical protein
MVFQQLAVHTRHLRNLFMFTTGFGDDGVRGHIEYPRWLLLSMSALEFLTFAGLYALAYAATGNILLGGGAVFCLLTAAQHYRVRRRLRPSGSPTSR